MYQNIVGRDSLVGIAMGWTVRGSNPGGGEILHTRPEKPWGPSYIMGTGSKAAGSWRDHPPIPSAEVKERVELYLFSPSGPSRPVLGWTLPLPLLIN